MTRIKNLVLICEGDGDADSVPILVRNWLYNKEIYDVKLNQPAINAKSSSKLKQPYDPKRRLGVEYYVNQALRANPDAILIVVDADDDCIKRSENGLTPLGPELLQRAQSVHRNIKVSLVVADPEFEAWMLASYESLQSSGRFKEGIALDDEFFQTSRSGCKSKIDQFMRGRYSESSDQPKLSNYIKIDEISIGRNRSLKKLNDDLNIFFEI